MRFSSLRSGFRRYDGEGGTKELCSVSDFIAPPRADEAGLRMKSLPVVPAQAGTHASELCSA